MSSFAYLEHVDVESKPTDSTVHSQNPGYKFAQKIYYKEPA